MTAQTIKSGSGYSRSSVVLVAACAVALVPELSFATGVDSTVGTYICTIADNFTGNAGRGIATIGISVIGTLACIARITWTQAIIAGVGVAVLFGAPAIAGTLGMVGVCP